jgi:flagellar assembly protein FliH
MTTAKKSSMTAWERWELASFDEAPHPHAAKPTAKPAADAVPPAPTFNAEEIAALRDAAQAEGYAAGRKEGFDEGYADGQAKGETEAREQGRLAAEALVAATDQFEAQAQALDAAVADEIVALATEIARRVIQQSVATRPETIVAVVREALVHLSVQHASIHLHPDDASLARSYAGEQLGHAGHRIHEDSRLARGDVVIESGGSHLDATLATRWRRVIESIGQDTPWVDPRPSDR